jgi:AmiR/NasT family two-component response regulator
MTAEKTRLDALGAEQEIARLHSVVATLSKTVLQLQGALDSRISIEQAKGILAARLDLDPEEAFKLMRRYARGKRVQLREVASEIVSTRGSPEWLTRLEEE